MVAIPRERRGIQMCDLLRSISLHPAAPSGCHVMERATAAPSDNWGTAVKHQNHQHLSTPLPMELIDRLQDALEGRIDFEGQKLSERVAQIGLAVVTVSRPLMA